MSPMSPLFLYLVYEVKPHGERGGSVPLPDRVRLLQPQYSTYRIYSLVAVTYNT